MNPRRAYKIIVADDEPDIREYFGRFLEKSGRFEATLVADGLAAVEQTRLIGPDLLVLDIQMPGLCGWDVVREIRKFDPSVKIIVITGQDAVTDEQQQLVNEHVSAFLQKPVVLEKIIHEITAVLGGDVLPAEFNPNPTVEAGKGKGRPEARRLVHSLANAHTKIRLKCEEFVLNYEQGYFKDRPAAELLEESVRVLKDVAGIIDESGSTVEEIRKL